MPTLQFKGKTAVEQHHRIVPHHVLELDAKLSLAKKPSLDGNLIIEGDNLLALKSLLPTHAGRVKCVYIDPPYNTGNEGWIYNDNLQQPQFKEWVGKEVGKEGEDACRHDKWCCMMYPRLSLLRELLTDDGVIFVSIDDGELANLLLMMDELYGHENQIGCLVWRSRNFPDARPTTGLSTDHEYVVAYGRTEKARISGKRRSEGKYTNPDDDSRGNWMSCSLLGKATRAQRPNLHYDLVDPKTKIVYPDPETGWICRPETMRELIRDKRILWPKAATGRPRQKVFLAELKSGRFGFPSVIDGIFTSDGTEEIRQIFAKPIFQFPKPSILISELIEQVAGPGDVVLDSFAGSGTTGHAVLRVNAAEGGQRRFVLVQQPFDTSEQRETGKSICDRVTRERVRRVALGFKNPEGDRIDGLGGDFTYARVGSRLLDEFHGFADKPPSYADLARYIWFTDTSQSFDPQHVNPESGKIGVLRGTSYYLLYAPRGKGRSALDREFLDGLASGKDKTPRKVVYCEKVWVHRDELAAHGVVAMVVPFHLK